MLLEKLKTVVLENPEAVKKGGIGIGIAVGVALVAVLIYSQADLGLEEIFEAGADGVPAE